MPVSLAYLQVVLYATVAVLWTIVAIAKSSTWNFAFAGVWWLLVAGNAVLVAKARAKRDAQRVTPPVA